MKFLKVLFLWMMMMAIYGNISSQTVHISGVVKDKNSGAPVSYATVFVKNSGYGTTCDSLGFYTLHLPAKYDTLIASFIGYEDKSMAIPSGVEKTINFVLEESASTLGEVVIFGDKLPLEEIILRNILKNKDRNNKDNFPNYQYEIYNKVEIDLKNLESKLLDARFLKPFSFVLENVDSTSDEAPFLPLFLTESLSDYYYKSNPKKKREVIKASKISGVQNDYVSQYLGNMYTEFNIYDNFIGVMLKEFVSPIANSCRFFYDYRMVDTVYTATGTYYRLGFDPKTKSDNTFSGDLLVDDHNFALKEIRLKMADHVNINFVKRIEIIQNFTTIDDSLTLVSDEKTMIEFAPLEKFPAIIGRKSTSYKDFKINQPEINQVIDDLKDEVTIIKGGSEFGDAYWDSARHIGLSKNENNIYHLIDTVKSTPAYKKYSSILYLLSTGYGHVGKIDLGSIYNLVVNNPYDGWKFNVGIRTNYKFNEYLQFQGSIGYGIKSKLVVGSAGVDWIFKKEHRQILGASYLHDVKAQTASTDIAPSDNILTRLVRRKVPFKLLLLDQAKLYYEREWKPGISSRITLQNRRIEPLLSLPLKFLQYQENEQNYDTITKINQSELVLNLRFAPKERYLSDNLFRPSLGTTLPIVEVEYAYGMKNLFKSNFSYHKVSLSIGDEFAINPIGNMRYKLWGGKVFGTVPSLLSFIPDGNETFFYNNGKQTFNLMNEYEFYADSWIALTLEHHFDGFFLNRIPGIRKLKWREVIETKMVWGKNASANQFANKESAMYSFGKIPYMEVGFGIENIFKFFRMDFLWRTTYRDHPNIPKFGAMLGMDFRL